MLDCARPCVEEALQDYEDQNHEETPNHDYLLPPEVQHQSNARVHVLAKVDPHVERLKCVPVTHLAAFSEKQAFEKSTLVDDLPERQHHQVPEHDTRESTNHTKRRIPTRNDPGLTKALIRQYESLLTLSTCPRSLARYTGRGMTALAAHRHRVRKTGERILVRAMFSCHTHESAHP
mmetsp:Transcript_128236/g.256099  ORF Transcript_128236/g.256099 Transcript_128236/m.256099 type:complete len:177 (-) Transcript_128236:144-674(-)